jgi:hypothetical protein
MADEHEDINEILEKYEKQFAETDTPAKVVAAQGLMAQKLHAVTQELCNLALHAEKEGTRLKAIIALQARVMGPVTAESISDPGDQMLRMMEAAAKRRMKKNADE